MSIAAGLVWVTVTVIPTWPGGPAYAKLFMEDGKIYSTNAECKKNLPQGYTYRIKYECKKLSLAN